MFSSLNLRKGWKFWGSLTFCRSRTFRGWWFSGFRASSQFTDTHWWPCKQLLLFYIYNSNISLSVALSNSREVQEAFVESHVLEASAQNITIKTLVGNETLEVREFHCNLPWNLYESNWTASACEQVMNFICDSRRLVLIWKTCDLCREADSPDLEAKAHLRSPRPEPVLA